MDNNTLERVRKKYVDAGRKDDAMIVLVAAGAGVEAERIEKYMTTDLNSAQLLEMLIALHDGVGEKSLETMADGKTSAEDMKSYRFRLRPDDEMNDLLEEITKVRELVEKIKIPQTDKTLKLLMEVKNQVSDVKAISENIEQEVKKEVAEEVKTDVKKEAVKSITPVIEKADPEMEKRRLAAYQALNGYPTKSDEEAAAAGNRPVDYVAGDAVISIMPREKEKPERLFGIFKKMNSDRLVHSETDKRKTMVRLLGLDLTEDKLKAISVGARCGIDPETLQKFAERAKSAGQIYSYINIFGEMFIENFKPVTA